jgi:hypothetical protein
MLYQLTLAWRVKHGVKALSLARLSKITLWMFLLSLSCNAQEPDGSKVAEAFLASEMHCGAILDHQLRLKTAALEGWALELTPVATRKQGALSPAPLYIKRVILRLDGFAAVRTGLATFFLGEPSEVTDSVDITGTLLRVLQYQGLGKPISKLDLALFVKYLIQAPARNH